MTLTGQSGPVNLASKMAPKEKSRKKEKKERRKTVEEINVESIRRINPPNLIQPDGYVERNLFLECLTANQPHSNSPARSTDRRQFNLRLRPATQPKRELLGML
jgi:hypothetical protein